MGDSMKKRNCIKVLSAAMSLIMLCAFFSPLMANAASNNAYTKGLQIFLDDGNHNQLVNCPDAVYMEYAEQLRTDSWYSFLMGTLGVIYEGLNWKNKIEPDKELYKQALLNIIRTYEEENAEMIRQNNLPNDKKEFDSYLHDVTDTTIDWLDAVDWLKIIGAPKELHDAINLALSMINELLKDGDEIINAISTLKTTVQNYEKHKTFLQLVAAQSEGELQLAATELSVGLTEVMKVRLLSYADLVKNSAEDYAKLFVCELFAEDFFDSLEKAIGKHIGKITYFQAFKAVKVGIDIGKLLGNLTMNAEDVLSYIVEIKAIYDIFVNTRL